MKVVIFTDSVTLFSTNAAVTRATIPTVAEIIPLRVDDITETRRGLGTRFGVTVTGTGEQISAFREALEGDGWQAGGGLIDQLVLNPALGALQRSLAKRWRKRAPRNWGPKPTVVPPSPDSPASWGDRDD